MKITISIKRLSEIGVLFLVIPICVFFLSFCKLHLGIIFSLLILVATYCAIKQFQDRTFEIELKSLVLGVFILAGFLLLTGQGGFMPQSWDNHTKNAIMRDMINCRWPIIYEQTDNALVYYFTYWFLPCLAGKILGWEMANLLLFTWSLLGVTLICLLILSFTPKHNHFALIVIIFIIFGGLNLLGAYLANGLHLVNHGVSIGTNEGWLDGQTNGFDSSYLYRGIYDAIMQSYNQSIPTWLVVAILMNNKSINTMAFIASLVFAFAPIPFVGLAMIFVPYVLIYGIRCIVKRQAKSFLSECISLPNILGSLSIAIPYSLLYMCNESSGAGLYIPMSAWTKERVAMLLLFYLLEFGVYALLIDRNEYIETPILGLTIIALLIIPLFRVGGGRDFCMNASMAGVFIILMCVAKTITSAPKLNIHIAILWICLFISATSPIFGIGHSLLYIRYNKLDNYRADNTYTLSDKRIGDDVPDTELQNYLCPDYRVKVFYNYVAKPKI